MKKEKGARVPKWVESLSVPAIGGFVQGAQLLGPAIAAPAAKVMALLDCQPTGAHCH
jgi:hypothetical protein